MKITEQVTVVIPHHNRHDLLAEILKDIKKFRVLIVKGGSFSKNCNDGFKIVETPAVVFLNDDTRIWNSEMLFSDMFRMLKTTDIVGCRVEKGLNGFNIIKKKLIPVYTTDEPVQFPSGQCLMMKTSTFKKLKGFGEEFVNGGEDIDLFMKAKKLKMKIGASKEIMQHMEHQSEGRFDALSNNVKLFNKKWGKSALALDEPVTKKLIKKQKEVAWINI